MKVIGRCFWTAGLLLLSLTSKCYVLAQDNMLAQRDDALAQDNALALDISSIKEWCKNGNIIYPGYIKCDLDVVRNDAEILNGTMGQIKNLRFIGTLRIETGDISKIWTDKGIFMPQQTMNVIATFFTGQQLPLQLDFSPYATINGYTATAGHINIVKITSTTPISSLLLGALKYNINNNNDINDFIKNYVQILVDKVKPPTNIATDPFIVPCSSPMVNEFNSLADNEIKSRISHYSSAGVTACSINYTNATLDLQLRLHVKNRSCLGPICIDKYNYWGRSGLRLQLTGIQNNTCTMRVMAAYSYVDGGASWIDEITGALANVFILVPGTDVANGWLLHAIPSIKKNTRLCNSEPNIE